MFLITRRDNLCPKTGLEPVIALLEGKCLNHLNYSGSYNCCTRLLGKEVYIRSVGASNGTRTRAVCLASRNTNRLYYTCIWVREPAEPLAHLICIYLERDSQVYPLGGQDWNRTRNLLITNQLHCQLCYLAIWTR